MKKTWIMSAIGDNATMADDVRAKLLAYYKDGTTRDISGGIFLAVDVVTVFREFLESRVDIHEKHILMTGYRIADDFVIVAKLLDIG